MTETIDKNIRIPIEVEDKRHTGHSIRSVVVSADSGIKALFCNKDNRVLAYLFAKNKDWSFEKAKEWVNLQSTIVEKIDKIEVDQEKEFLKLIATYKDGVTEEWIPNNPSFILEASIEDETVGFDKARGEGQGVGGQRQGDGGANTCICPKCGKEVPHEKGKPCNETKCPECGENMVGKTEKATYEAEGMELLKVDNFKQIVYGVFLVPDKADHHGDVISEEDIEKVAHDFLVEYRTIDEMHKNVIHAEIVESAIAWKDGIDYFGKKLNKGTWFGAIKIKDKDVWGKVLAGEYKAFSVRIAGVREPIEKES